jgi:hypothetical protein
MRRGVFVCLLACGGAQKAASTRAAWLDLVASCDEAAKHIVAIKNWDAERLSCTPGGRPPRDLAALAAADLALDCRVRPWSAAYRTCVTNAPTWQAKGQCREP